MMLRPYQQDAINATFGYFQKNTGNPVIAMPTGTGKSHVIGGFVQQSLQWYPSTTFMVLTHVKELIRQNHAKLVEGWPNAPAGIYSAGLKQRQTYMPITFGGIASVIKAVEAGEFGRIDILFIDECHLLNSNADTMYARLIMELKKKNPYLKVIGLTATPWRTGQGHLIENGIFTDMAIDMTGFQAFNWFIAEGYLAKLIPRPTATQFDLSGVGITGGDYNQGDVTKAVDRYEITLRALQELCYYGQDRHSWLIFSSGVEHADHICEMLNAMGIPTTVVHRGIPATERDKRIADFKAGLYRAIVNNNILTTGFDHPAIDLIGMLRATMSPGLWVQMLGRGTRPLYNIGNYPPSILDTVEGRFWAMQNSLKQNCLVLDFAGNTGRLGPINDPMIPRKSNGAPGDAPVKKCETAKLKINNFTQPIGCGVWNHASARYCDNCGAEFDFSVKISTSSSNAELILSEPVDFQWLDINNVFYSKHVGPSGTPCLRVDYYSGKKCISDFIFLEHTGYNLHKAKGWWTARFKGDGIPPTVDQALPYANSTWLKTPIRLRIWKNKPGGKPDILSYEYE